MSTYLKTAIVLLASALFCIALTQNSPAATTNVMIGPNFTDTFSPPVVSIAVNDSVIWDWQGTFHSTTSGTNGVPGDDNGVPSGLWDSGVITSTPHTFTNTFTSAGVFYYYCAIHHSFGMTGQVVVASSTLPPNIVITNPADGAVFAAPANVTVQASVSNGSGNVTNVSFLVNNNPLTNETAGPFSATTNNLTPGAYTLSAIAMDDNGILTSHSIAISVITPAPISLTNASQVSNSHFQFTYSADIGLNYVVQRSTDLMTWLPLATNKAANNPITFDDLNATNALDFYRVGRLPNP